jgi:hypothetical protein
MRSHKFGAGALALLLASATSGVADGQSGKPRFGKPISEGDSPPGTSTSVPRTGRISQAAKEALLRAKFSSRRNVRRATAMTPRADRCTARWSAASDRSPPIPAY